MSKYRWLIDQLPEWEKSGLVPPEVALRLRAYAESQAKLSAGGKGESRVAQIVMGALGALLVGAGVLALIAHNWDQVPRNVRLAGSFAILAAAQGLVAWIIHRGEAAPRWVREAGGLFLVLAAGGCLALVSQIYNMGGNWPDFLLVWVILAVPVLWSLSAHSCAIFHLIGIAVWTVNGLVGSSWLPWNDSPWLYPILLAAALIYWPGLSKPRPPLPNAVRWVAVMSVLAGFSALAFHATRDARGDGGIWLCMLTFANVAMVPLTREGADERLTRKPQVVLGGLGLLCMGFVYSTQWGARGLGASLDAASRAPWCWVLVAVFLAFAVTGLLHRRWAVVAVGSLALVPLLSFALLQVNTRPNLSWAFTIHLFAIGLVMILAGFYSAKGSPRFGALLIACLILVRMSDSELPLLTKSVVFIITGLAFIAFNIVWSRVSHQKEVGA